VGGLLDLDPGLLAMPNGSSASRLVVHDGDYAAMGCTVSSGYREFKVSDGYRDDVIAVIYERFGAVREHVGADLARVSLESTGRSRSAVEVATFFSDAAVFALEVEHVREARPASEISPVTIGSPARSVGMLRVGGGEAGEKMIWVFDLPLLVRGKPSSIEDGNQVVVVEHMGQTIGLLTEELHSVCAFDETQISAPPLAGAGHLVKGIIQANGGALLIQLLDAACLFNLFREPAYEVTRLERDSDQDAANTDDLLTAAA
jgi:chemotaxis signal transduction protein